MPVIPSDLKINSRYVIAKRDGAGGPPVYVMLGTFMRVDDGHVFFKDFSSKEISFDTDNYFFYADYDHSAPLSPEEEYRRQRKAAAAAREAATREAARGLSETPERRALNQARAANWAKHMAPLFPAGTMKYYTGGPRDYFNVPTPNGYYYVVSSSVSSPDVRIISIDNIDAKVATVRAEDLRDIAIYIPHFGTPKPTYLFSEWQRTKQGRGGYRRNSRKSRVAKKVRRNRKQSVRRK
jgi:hypothetical protein